MFVGFCDMNLKMVIPQENILKISMFGARISIYYSDFSAFTNEKYIENIELEYDSEEKAYKNWNEFITALNAHADIFFFDSDVK